MLTAVSDKPELAGEPQRVALSMVASGKFADPFLIETGYTAHLPPVQPALLSILYRLFGAGSPGERAKQASTIVAGAAVAGLIPLAVQALGLPWMVGLFAGLAGCWPVSLFDIHSPFGEQLSAVLVLISCIVTWRHGWAWQTSLRWITLQGALWGVLLLLNTATLTILFAILAVELVRGARSNGYAAVRTWLTNVSLTVLIIVLIVTPWMFRNKQRLGSFALRSNLGIEVHMGFNEKRSPDAGTSHPNNSVEEALLVREIGEIAYNKLKLNTAIQWIRTHPEDALSLTLQRIILFWFPESLHGISFSYPIRLLTVVSLAGFVLMWRVKPWHTTQLVAILAVFPLIYYVTRPFVRYRFPIYWITLIGAAYAGYELVQYALRRREMSPATIPDKTLPEG